MPKIIGGSLTEHRMQTRNKLFAALTSLMAERGFDAITLADVAAAAGVGRTAVYNHVADKEALLIALITHETEQYVATLARALDEAADPTEQLRRYVRQHSQLSRVFHHVPGRELSTALSRDNQVRIREHVVVVEEMLRGVLAAGIAAGAFPDQDLDVTVPLVHACLTNNAVPEAGPRRQAAVAATEEFVLRAVGAR